jgi:hypothetical protein
MNHWTLFRNLVLLTKSAGKKIYFDKFSNKNRH